jgi:hypothetical protein
MEQPPEYVRNMEEVKAALGNILITNYERVRDGVGYLEAAARDIEMPTLFDFIGNTESDYQEAV